ncbi:MAG: hypothetical protein WC967_11495 [Balneolaceae bacterium]
MYFIKYTCTGCKFKSTDISTWGHHYYAFPHRKIFAGRNLALCHNCNDIVSVEQLSEELRSDDHRREKLLWKEFIRSRKSGPKCLNCGGLNFDLIEKTRPELGERNPFDIGLIHHNCGGRILADMDTPYLFMGNNLPQRYYDLEGNAISTPPIYILDLIPRLHQTSNELNDINAILDTQWRHLIEDDSYNSIYIFRNNNELFVSKTGDVKKGRWEYLGDNSLLIDLNDSSTLYTDAFYSEFMLGFKKEGTDEYVIFVNKNHPDATGIYNLDDFKNLANSDSLPGLKVKEEENAKKGKKLRPTIIVLVVTLALISLYYFFK